MDVSPEVDHADLGAQIEATGQAHEKMERTEAVSKFAVNFLHAINPTVDEDRIQAELFGDQGNNIFSGTVEEHVTFYEKRIEQGGINLAGYESMLRLARFYLDSKNTLPDSIIAITNYKQLKNSNFHNLFTPGEKALVYYASNPDDKREELNFDAVPGESPDVVLAEIGTTTGLRVKRAESFSLKGAENVFLRSPNINNNTTANWLYNPNFTISVSCKGTCELMPTPPVRDNNYGRPWIYIEAGTVRQPSGTTFAPTEVVCDNYERLGGEIINAHPNTKVKIKIRGGKFDDKSGEPPLDPRNFELTGDEEYERLQAEYVETVLRNQMLVPAVEKQGDDPQEKVAEESAEPKESHSRDEWVSVFNERHGKFADGEEAEVTDEELTVWSYTVPVDRMTLFLRDARAAGFVVNGVPRGDGFISVTVEQEPS